MKIIFIPHLPTLYGRRYNLAKNLAKEGHEVHFIVWDMPYPLTLNKVITHIINSLRAKTYKEDRGFIIHQVRRLPFFWPVINGLIFKRQVRKIYNNGHAQVIMSQAFTNETEPPLEFPLVYDINDDHQAFADIYGSSLYRFGYKLLGVKSVIARQSKRALLVTTVSERLTKFAKQYNDNVIKIPNGVESEALRFYQKNTANPKQHSILYISTFGKWSRLSEVIGSVQRLKETYPDIHLNLVGEGTELAKAKAQVANLGLKNYVTFYGKISNRKKIFQLISNAEICLNISEKNAFRDAASPIKVFEYSAFGKIVISSNVSEVVSLNFPNVVILSDAKPSNLRKTIEATLNQDVGRNLATKALDRSYTWEALTKTLSKNLKEVVR